MSSTKDGGASRYIVGIDLGTTNSALAYVDTVAGAEGAAPRVLLLPQWETPGAAVESETLPSFFWLPEKSEWKRGQLRLPLHGDSEAGGEPPDHAVGRAARAQTALTPGRVVHSAKSWLAHAGVDREERILPWSSDEIVGVERRSPIEVSAAYLAHLKAAWNHRQAAHDATYRLENQDVVITVPASFDEVAQRLTLDAAQKAGLDPRRVRLLEEPQAAFYYWLSRHTEADALAARLPALRDRPQTVLICDIGGGTTDFSLFEVSPEIRRVAVSDHILLGGDNIDLSLAHLLERKLLGGGRLSSRQWALLVVEARRLKELALGEAADAEDAELFVSIPGEGASLFAKALTVGIRRSEIVAHVLAGFLPDCEANDSPRAQRAGALTELGLPYAQDGAMTRHLAAFVAGHQIDAVLYTGGTLKPRFMQQRLSDMIERWQGRRPVELDNDQMDLAVALGASWSGAATRRESMRIRAGYPRSLYLEVARAGRGHSLVCIVPKGMEPGRTVRIDQHALKAVAGQPVRFQIFSALKRADEAGAVTSLSDDTFHPLPALHTRLELDQAQRKGAPAGGLLDVHLEVQLTETGVLELFVVHDSPAFTRRWQLTFNVRSIVTEQSAQPAAPTSEVIEPERLAAVKERLEAYYGKKRGGTDLGNPKYLVRELEETIGRPRDEWDTTFLRSLWPLLEDGLTRRGRSMGHELTWLYLAGYALRPGYGFELDEWRVESLWRVYQMGLTFPAERQVEEQWWIMWRRVAGGLSREAQERLYDKIFPSIRKGDASSAEVYVLAGSLERIDMTRKLKLGSQLAQDIGAGRKQFLDQRIWALARIASRVPLYGGPQAIVRPKFVAEWLKQVAHLDPRRKEYAKLALFYAQAGRLVGDREFDLPDDLRRAFIQRLELAGAAPEQIRPLRELVPVDTETRSRLFGEALPAGLLLS